MHSAQRQRTSSCAKSDEGFASNFISFIIFMKSISPFIRLSTARKRSNQLGFQADCKVSAQVSPAYKPGIHWNVRHFYSAAAFINAFYNILNSLLHTFMFHLYHLAFELFTNITTNMFHVLSIYVGGEALWVNITRHLLILFLIATQRILALYIPIFYLYFLRVTK